jgi:hypothetical protein
MAAPLIGKLIFAWLLLRNKNSALPGTPGQGGITKQLTLKGLDGRRFQVTFFGDHTRLVETDRVVFFVREPEVTIPIKVLFGSKADLADAIKNFPE